MQTLVGGTLVVLAVAGVFYGYRHYEREQAAAERARTDAVVARLAEQRAGAEAAPRPAESRAGKRPGRMIPRVVDGAPGPAGTSGPLPSAGAVAERRFARNVHIDLEILQENSGVIAYSDGQLIFDERLEHGNRRVIEADREVRMVVDTPRVVIIKVNGQEQPRIDRGRGLILTARYADGHVAVTEVR